MGPRPTGDHVTVPLIVLTNGRPECISRTIASARQHLSGVGPMTIVDDSGDPVFGQWLVDEFTGGPLDGRVLHLPDEHGYWQAMRMVWSYARHLVGYLDVESVFFLEEDFVFGQDIDAADLQKVLATHRYLTQIALLRQPWFPNERTAGGLIEALEAQGQQFTETTDGCGSWWVEHRACFTGNPCLIPTRTFERDWPEGPWSESRFGQELFRDPMARGAYWGRRTDPPRVEHIGVTRVGTDY